MPSVSIPTIAMDIGLSAEAVGTASEIGAGISSVVGAIGSVASYALPLAGLASSGLSAYSSVQQGKQAATAANYNASVAANNAQIATQNATVAGQVGAEQTAIEQQKTRAAIGGIKAAQAASGIDVNSESAVDVRSSAEELGQLNAITVRSNAARTAYGYQTQAQSDTSQSQLDQQEAGYDKTAGYDKAATTLLGNAVAGSQSGLWDSFNQTKSLLTG